MTGEIKNQQIIGCPLLSYRHKRIQHFISSAIQKRLGNKAFAMDYVKKNIVPKK
jgi:hypothetical protein